MRSCSADGVGDPRPRRILSGCPSQRQGWEVLGAARRWPHIPAKGRGKGALRDRRESGPPAARLPSGARENRPGGAPGRHACSQRPGRPRPCRLGRLLPPAGRSASGMPSCCSVLGTQAPLSLDSAPSPSPGAGTAAGPQLTCGQLRKEEAESQQ